MDPILLAAVQKLQERLQAVRETGVEVTPANIEEFLRSETGGKYGLKDYRAMQTPTADNMVRAIGYGLSANQLDNILGLFSKKAAEESRVREEAYSERHPIHAMLGGLVGSLITGKAMDAGITKLLGETHTIPDAIKAGALAGGSYGAVDAAGRSDDEPLGGKLRNAAMGGLAGSLVGGTLGGTFAGAAKVFQPKASGVNRITGAITKEGGYEKVMENLDDATKAGRGEDVVLADLSPHLAKALDFAANASDNVLVPTAELLESRTAGRAARLLEDVRAHMGEPARLINPRPEVGGSAASLAGEPDYGLRVEQLARNTANVGNKVYGELAAKNPTFDVSTLPLDKPKIAKLWEQARLAGNLTGNGPMDELMARLTAANPGAPKSALQQIARQYGGNAERPVTLDDLTSLRRALKGQADAAFTANNYPLGNALKSIREEVDNALEAGAPGYKAANAAYTGANDLERANESGHDWWMKADKRALARAVDELKDQPGALDEFRLGIASGLVEKLQATATNRDAARELMQASEDLDAKLKLVFGDERTFQSFMQRAKVEREMGRLSKTIGGSETARRMEAKGYTPEELGVDALTHGPGVLARAGAGLAKNALRQRAANQMGPLLLTKGAPNIQRVLQLLQQQPDLYGGADIPAFGRRLRFDEFLRSGAPVGLMSTVYPALFGNNGQ